MMNSKRAQAWGFDLAAGLVIFLSGIIFFYFYSNNNFSGNEQNLALIKNEAKFVSGSLLTSGAPDGWNETSVSRIGFYDAGKINLTKLEYFYNLSSANYQTTKNIFSINDDYYVYFPDGVLVGGNLIFYIGNNATQNATNIAKVSRAVVYDNKIVSMEVGVWN